MLHIIREHFDNYWRRKFMFKNILVAVDGSEHSKKALNYALELAEKFDGKITLIHVYSSVVPLAPAAMDTLSPPTPTPPVSIAMAAKIGEGEANGQTDSRRGGAGCKRAQGSGGESFEGGRIRQRDCGCCPRGKIRPQSYGTQGLEQAEGIFLGSVSEGVSHKAPCPVMIVK